MRSMRRFCWLAAAGLVAGCVHYQDKPLSAGRTAADFEARSLADPALHRFIETNLHREFTEWPPAQWDFDMLTLAAFYFHPSLDVARAQWGLATAGRKTAGARPNPTASLQPGYNFSAAPGVTPWFPGLTVDWPIETAGKRGKRLTRAEQLAEAARLNIAVTAWQVRANLRVALIQFSDGLQRKAILQTQLGVQEKLLQALEQRLAAGAASISEVHAARVALQKIQAEIADATRQVSESSHRVAEAIGVPAGKFGQQAIGLAWRVPVDSELTSTDLRRAALTNRADIVAALRDYAAAEAALQIEIARQWPDVHLGPSYQWDQGESKWTLGLSAELPVLNRNQGPIAETTARRTETAARFTALQAKAIADIDRATDSYRTAQNRLAALNDLHAAQLKQHDALAAQVNAGAIDRLELLAFQAEAAAVELLKWDGGIKAMLAYAQLEDAIQRPLDLPGGPGAIEQGVRTAKDNP